jgi:ABC-type multidrug transport system fused ATPase/permease subunit
MIAYGGPPLLGCSDDDDEPEGPDPNGAKSFILPYTETIRDRVIFDFDANRITHKPKLIAVTSLCSGSGTSTLANLLLGLYAPNDGRILIDGVPQSEWDMRWIRRQLAVVLQDSILLSGTVRENLRFAKADATEAEIRTAARQANAEEFIQRLPQGYDTLVGERGTTLSGGQRQRLAIARAVLRNPPVLILDEATSALDYESERLIQEAIDRLSAGRTVITIAHRLSTIRNASRIVVLDAGRLIEEGNFATLLARNGAFARLVAAQEVSQTASTPEPPLSP